MLFPVSLLRAPLAPEACYPAGEASLVARHVQLASGERVRVVEGGAADAPPVLFVHGWGASAYYYRKLLPAVMAAGWRVAALDLRGHGHSDKPRDATRYTAEAMADLVAEVLEGLGADAAVLVAHSLGGGVALDVARLHPQRVRALTLLAPVGLAPLRFVPLARLATPVVAAPLVRYAVPPWSVPLALRAVNGTLGDFGWRDVDEYWAPTRDPDFGWALRTLLHRFRLDPRGDDELATIAVPVHVLLGGQDFLVRAGASVARVAALPGWRAEVVPRAGHVLAEEVPHFVLRALLAQLAALR